MRHLGKTGLIQTRRLAGKRSAYELQIRRDWPHIVGEQVAKWARPERLFLDRSGDGESKGAKLELRVQAAFVLEIQQSIPLIKTNINRHMGFDLVSHISLKQSYTPLPPLGGRKPKQLDHPPPVDLSQLPDKRPADEKLTLGLARLQALIKQKNAKR